MGKYGVVFLFISVTLFIAIVYFKDVLSVEPLTSNIDSTPTISQTEKTNSQESQVQVMAENLNIPWSIAVLPNGELLVTERQGNLIRIGTEQQTIQKIEGVAHVGEGGLHGIALHPNFSENNQIYLYSTTMDNKQITNRVERYELLDNRLDNRVTIIKDIPGSNNHDGGAIAFGPDGFLYITTGDAQDEQGAQNVQTLNGKILRLKDDGSIPEDNPFGNPVYSYGHRNPQSLVWDDAGNLWSTEHGPSGVQSGYDEINIISKGSNYGWPVIKGDEANSGMETPKYHSGGTETWAPAGAVYYKGALYFAGLRGSSIYKATISGNSIENVEKYLTEQYGRLRAITITSDGNVYISTSNRDGRGSVKENDDKIIKVNLNTLQ